MKNIKSKSDSVKELQENVQHTYFSYRSSIFIYFFFSINCLGFPFRFNAHKSNIILFFYHHYYLSLINLNALHILSKNFSFQYIFCFFHFFLIFFFLFILLNRKMISIAFFFFFLLENYYFISFRCYNSQWKMNCNRNNDLPFIMRLHINFIVHEPNHVK